MSDWITDRRPTEDDGKYVYSPYGNVCLWSEFRDGEPWKPIPKCEPYVKPKRWTVRFSRSAKNWVVDDRSEIRTILSGLDRDDDQHREAAERIAAIYEEVMP